MRKPKDRDFIETSEDLFFCVTGYLHPSDKYTAYLKYAPAEENEETTWIRGSTYYFRQLKHYHVCEVRRSMINLKKKLPHYVYWCPVRNVTLIMVPKSFIRKYYEPEGRVNELLHSETLDSLEEKAAALIDTLSEHSGVRKRSFGLTGSLLLKIHDTKVSDIDLTVYGMMESLKVKETLLDLYKQGGEINRTPREKREEWLNKRRKIFPLPVKQLQRIAGKKWNYGVFKGEKPFSVHPTRKNQEIRETYGEKLYYPMGKIRVLAEVEDASEAIFNPSIYRVNTIKTLVSNSNNRFIDVSEIISYEGLYMDAAKEGDVVEVNGKLEKVVWGKGREYFRVVIGTFEFGDKEYFKVVKEA